MSREITLPEILEARERRVQRQRQLLSAHRTPLVCFTMNIAGPVKTTPLIERGFDAGLCALKATLPADKILALETERAETGCTAFLAVDLPAEELKRITSSVEEANPLGRLFDMDVLDREGNKLSRPTLRGCIVCGKEGRDCAARRLHTVEELQTATTRLLADHFAALAVDALITEAETTPKPGLVDRSDRSSHTDMDLPMMRRSAQALRPYFIQCITLGNDLRDTDPDQAFQALRKAGLEAEQTMLRATGGVNTHKGAIFIMGLLLGAMGRSAPESLCETAGLLCAQAMEQDLKRADGRTHGEAAYLRQRTEGVRGEARNGFPSIRNLALPTLQSCLKEGLEPNHARIVTLLHLIAEIEDTTLLHRGGTEGLEWAKAQAKSLLPRPAISQAEELDLHFCRRRLSPGGSADLLAATCFLAQLNQ